MAARIALSKGPAAAELPGLDAVAQAATLGRTMVVVPHPDDETLGCGGLLALLAQAGVAVMVVLVSDGAASHRHSASHPADRLRMLRLRELTAALRILGLGSPLLWAMGLPDGAVPFVGDPAFDIAVNRFERKAGEFQPQTVVLPWRHDEHPDHRASHAIASSACDRAASHARRLEYVVWPSSQDEPGPGGNGRIWRIAIDRVVQRKCRALQAHRSQLGLVIHDDPGGFVLPAAMEARCSLPTETYFDTPTSRP